MGFQKNKILLGIFILVFLAGCASFAPTPKNRFGNTTYQKQVQINVTSIKALKEKNDELGKLNASLGLKIKEFEKRIVLLRKKQLERLKNMDYTISLMELSIKDLQKQYVADLRKKASSRDKEKNIVINSVKTREISEKIGTLIKLGAGIELKTPSNSKAIENFSLKLVNPKRKETKKVVIPTKKSYEFTQESWEDSDLQPPKSPIFLEVYPGAKSHYNRAFKSYTRREYVKAIDQFEEFLVRYPNDQYADNSQFWIGEAYFNLKDYQQSEHAFRKVLRNYEHGETRKGYKTPDSILMLGRIYLVRNKPIKARKYFEQVKKSYPKSRSANKSIKEIQSMQAL